MKGFITKRIHNYIVKNRLKMSAADMSKHFGLHNSIVDRYMRKHKLSVPVELQKEFRRKANKHESSATTEEDAYILKNYLNLPVKTIAADINRSGGFVTRRIAAQGLVIPLEIIKKRQQDSRIKSGSFPPNKGKRWEEYMSPEAMKRCSATHFKKGNRPPQTKERNGVITIRKDRSGTSYKYIRISLGKWKLYHQHLWEKKHGKIPAGMCLWFKDRNSLNCTLKNMELINRSENLRRNRSKYLQLHPDLRKASTLLNKLNKAIYGKEQTN